MAKKDQGNGKDDKRGFPKSRSNPKKVGVLKVHQSKQNDSKGNRSD